MPAPCGTCEKKEHEDFEPSPWFGHISFLYSLQKAGYPFAKNDLSMDEWTDLAIFKEEIEKLKWQTPTQ